MPEIDDRVRSAFASVMDPPEEAGARIREAALRSLEPAPRRTAVRWARRALRPVPALAAAVLVAAVAAVLFLAAPADTPTAPPDVRGVEMVVRADPPSQTERLAQVLRERGELRGVTGMTVDVAGGVVHVVVPRTHDAGWPVANLLTALDTAVFRTGASVIASDRRLQAVLDAVPAPAPGEAVRWYAAAPAATAGRSLLLGPYGDEASARRAEGFGDQRLRVVAVPAGITLAMIDHPVGSGGSLRFAALRDPLVAPGEITAVEGVGTELRFVVAPAARDRVAAALAADPTPVLMATYGGPGAVPSSVTRARFDRYEPSSGTLVLRLHGPSAGRAGPELARILAPGGVDARVGLVSAAPVGPPPARQGDAVPAGERPGFLRRLGRGDFANDPFRPRPDTARLVIRARTPGGREVTLWSYTAVNGRDLVTGGGGTGGCPIAPDFPVIFPCMSGGSFVVGRVGDGVATVTAEFADGTTREATVANGFFLFLGMPRGSGPDRLVARDAGGAELGRLENGAAGSLPLGIGG